MTVNDSLSALYANDIYMSANGVTARDRAIANAKREADIAEAMAVAEQKKQELRTQELLNKMELQKKEEEIIYGIWPRLQE